MKKLILLFPLVVILAITVSCERDSVVAPTPPTVGVWDETIPVLLERLDGADTSRILERLTWAEMLEAHAENLSATRYTANFNDLRFIIKEFNFLPDRETLQITVRYGGEGLTEDDDCGENEGGVIVRRVYIEIAYSIIEEHDGIGSGKIDIRSGRYTGSTFGNSPPSDCSNEGPITDIHFEFTYQDEDRETMNFYQIGDVVNPDNPNETITGIQSTHFLQRRPLQ